MNRGYIQVPLNYYRGLIMESQKIDERELAVLLNWLRNVKRAQDGHYAAAHSYSLLNLWIGIPAVILSTIIGTGIFSTLGNDIEIPWKVAAGIASVLSAVLIALQTFLKLPDKSARHVSAAAEYGALRRELQEAELLLKQNKVDPISKLRDLRKKLDELAKETPKIPKRIIDKLLIDIPVTPLSRYYPEEHMPNKIKPDK